MERSCLESEGDNSSGFLWPQTNYKCSFCKRQFNSAQALGGHMNVHRRDRAMLIQLPSWVFDQCPNPTPKSHPSSSTYCSASTLLPYNYTYHHFLSSSSYREKKKPTSQLEASVSLSEDLTKKMKKKKNMTSVVEVEELKGELEVFEKSELISLDLEIGCKDPKEVLDLELRLGCF